MKNLKAKRLKLGMTQIDIAKAVGVSTMTYQLWEREAATPKPENEQKLKEVLGVKE